MGETVLCYSWYGDEMLGNPTLAASPAEETVLPLNMALAGSRDASDINRCHHVASVSLWTWLLPCVPCPTVFVALHMPHFQVQICVSPGA